MKAGTQRWREPGKGQLDTVLPPRGSQKISEKIPCTGTSTKGRLPLQQVPQTLIGSMNTIVSFRDGDNYRDPQLDRVQSVRDAGTLSPKSDVSIKPLPSAQETLWRRRGKECKSQWRQKSPRKQGLLNTTGLHPYELPEMWHRSKPDEGPALRGTQHSSHPYLNCPPLPGKLSFLQCIYKSSEREPPCPAVGQYQQNQRHFLSFICFICFYFIGLYYDLFICYAL